jgi:polar amino acid transport system substrate-binding protein
MVAGTCRILGACAVVLTMGGAQAGATKAEIVRLSTLEWPPYVGQDLPGGGATTEVVRAAFGKAGYQIEVEFRPWKRAVDMVDKGTDQVIACFPAYHCTHLGGFLASDPIGAGPLGFALHTVLGYANTEASDAKVRSGDIVAIQSVDDLTNLRKLQRKRIDAVVVDKFVLEYMKITEPSLKAGGDLLHFNAKPLADKALYVGFRPDADGQETAAAFNAGLEQVEIDSIVEPYFETAFPD